MIDEQPAFGRLYRSGACPDLGRLPGPPLGRHYVAVAAPVGHVRARGEEDVAEGSVAFVARTRQHQVGAADLAREENSVAVVRQ